MEEGKESQKRKSLRVRQQVRPYGACNFGDDWQSDSESSVSIKAGFYLVLLVRFYGKVAVQYIQLGIPRLLMV